MSGKSKKSDILPLKASFEENAKMQSKNNDVSYSADNQFSPKVPLWQDNNVPPSRLLLEHYRNIPVYGRPITMVTEIKSDNAQLNFKIWLFYL